MSVKIYFLFVLLSCNSHSGALAATMGTSTRFVLGAHSGAALNRVNTVCPHRAFARIKERASVKYKKINLPLIFLYLKYDFRMRRAFSAVLIG